MVLSTTSTVYIDEAGDLGANVGTRWFILTAVIVDKSDERAVRQTLNSIRSSLNVRTIHFRTIRDHGKRIHVVSELSKHNFRYANIIFDTDQYDTNRIPNNLHAYNHMCNYLLQRVSWYMRDANKTADIILSARGTKKDQMLIDYINTKLLVDSQEHNIANVFGSAEAKTYGTWDMLELVDVCASSLFNSYERNAHGFVTPCYAEWLAPKLLAYKNRVEKYGIKYYNDSMKPQNNYFDDNSACILKRGIPSATTT